MARLLDVTRIRQMFKTSFLPVSLLGKIHPKFLNQFGKGSVKR